VRVRVTWNTSTRGSYYVDRRTILADMRLTEVERRMRVVVIENEMTRTAIVSK
jgi:hypothetical protein